MLGRFPHLIVIILQVRGNLVNFASRDGALDSRVSEVSGRKTSERGCYRAQGVVEVWAYILIVVDTLPVAVQAGHVWEQFN